MGVFGQALPRVEDGALLTGRARFLDDLEVARDALQLVVLRSPFAHAALRSGSPPGMREVRVFGGEDVAHLRWPQLLQGPPPVTPLAVDRARYTGQPVAAAVAEEVVAAEEALELLDIDYEPLPAAITVEDALAANAPLVYEELRTNVIWRDVSQADERAFAQADVVIGRTFRSPRLAPAMLECRGILAVPEGDGLTVYAGHQNPHKLHGELCDIFGLDPIRLRVVVPEVGGAFGAKAPLYPEYVLCVHTALELGRAVKFVERRTENLMVTTHGRGQVQRIRLAAASDGTLAALGVEIDADFGAAVDVQRWCVALTRRMLSGAYRIPHLEWSIRGVLTHTPPVGAFRGAGRPEAAYLVERAMDELARELGMDPAELRRRNFISSDEFPYETGTGAVYDSGDYRTALDLALEQIDYEEFGTEPPTPGKLRGIGMACYVEMSAGGDEYAEVVIDEAARVTVSTGTLPHGQGHDTTWAQVTADRLGVGVERVRVMHGDTAAVPRGGGTSGSRSAPLGGSAVGLAAEKVAEQLRDLAAEKLEAAAADIRLREGRAEVAGTDVGIELAQLLVEHGTPLQASEVFTGTSQNFPFGTHVCVVEVDTETGEVTVVDYVEVDDCGTVINPLVVEGQLHGGTLQGISHALSEAVRFDEDGQLLTANLTAYLIPTVRMVPSIRGARTETPSPLNPMGVKGVGESGITGATPAVANGVFDALSGLGIGEEHLSMPFTPARVWDAIKGTR